MAGREMYSCYACLHRHETGSATGREHARFDIEADTSTSAMQSHILEFYLQTRGVQAALRILGIEGVRIHPPRFGKGWPAWNEVERRLLANLIGVHCWCKMRKFDLSLRSSRSSYFATFRHQLTILSKTDALDEEKWLNMLGTFVKDWFRYESHFVHGRDSLVDILKERGLLSESDAVQPLIGKKS